MDEPVFGFSFGRFSLNLETRELRCDHAPVALEPRAFDLLVYLVQNRNRLVGKEELLSALWEEEFVSYSSLTTAVAQVRKSLGDRRPRRFVATRHGHGYRFVAEVMEISESDRDQVDRARRDSAVPASRRRAPRCGGSSARSGARQAGVPRRPCRDEPGNVG